MNIQLVYCKNVGIDQLPDLLRPLRLCQQITLCIKGIKRGPRSPRKTSFFSLRLRKSHSQRLRKETLRSSRTGAVPNQVTHARNMALIRIPGNELRFQRARREQQKWDKRDPTPSVLRAQRMRSPKKSL